MPNKIDSNVVGLRFAEESATPKVLPGSPVWYPLEPNSYDNFGGNLTTTPRNPINASRQRKKGMVTDLDASGGFSMDLLQQGLQRIFQGFFFADWREKLTTAPINSAALALTSVVSSTKTVAAASGLAGFLASDLVLASGFALSGNNGLKTVASSTASTVVVVETMVDEASPPAAAKLVKVGFAHPLGTVDVTIVSGLPRLNRASGTKDFTTFGLIPGEWVFIGGDSAGQRFVNAVNSCFARVQAVTATYIEFDKTSQTMVAETGTGITLRMFYGNVLKNESDPLLIKRRTYNLERTLGKNDGGQVLSEYLTGAVCDSMTINMPQADKVTVDFSFVAMDHELRDGPTGVKAGARPALPLSDAFNTSSDFSRIKMSLVTTSANPTPLYAFLSELTLSLSNNVQPEKAVGVLGAFDVRAGTFEVSGSTDAYFADIAAVQAIRSSSDVTLDFALVRANAGFLFDIPLIALGNGRLDVEQDQSIKLNLSTDAAEGADGHTLLLNEFPYLPNAADL